MGFGSAGRDPVALLTAYAFGCLASGYYLVRWRTGADLRAHGTGSIGATNAARVLGPGAFTAVFLADLAKGALAVRLGRRIGGSKATPALAAVAVTAGHLWPVQLGFRGGKGISTAFGAALVLSPPAALGALATAGLALAAGCRVVLSGLVGVAFAPAIALLLRVPAMTAGGIGMLTALVVIGHRRNIDGMLRGGEPWSRRGRDRRAGHSSHPAALDRIPS